MSTSLISRERHTSYGAGVQWARFLAAKRIEVPRYDGRGVGKNAAPVTAARVPEASAFDVR